MTLPHFLEITRDLYFVAGHEVPGQEGAVANPAKLETSKRFHFLAFFTSLYQPVPFVFVFSGNKIKVGGDR